MNSAAAALASSANHIVVTTGSDDRQAAFFAADDTAAAFEAAAERSLATSFPVKAIERYEEGSTVSTFVAGTAVSVEMF